MSNGHASKRPRTEREMRRPPPPPPGPRRHCRLGTSSRHWGKNMLFSSSVVELSQPFLQAHHHATDREEAPPELLAGPMRDWDGERFSHMPMEEAVTPPPASPGRVWEGLVTGEAGQAASHQTMSGSCLPAGPRRRPFLRLPARPCCHACQRHSHATSFRKATPPSPGGWPASRHFSEYSHAWDFQNR